MTERYTMLKENKYFKLIGYLLVFLCIAIFISIEVSVLLIMAMFIYYLHILIHELGHLCMGLMSGYTFNWIRVENIVLYKKNGKYEICYQPVPGLNGQCAMTPTENSDPLSFSLFHLGGILANFFTSGLLSILLLATLPNILRTGVVIFSVTALIVAIANLIPYKENDGYHFFNGWRSTAKRTQINNIHRLSAGIMNGESYEDLEKNIYFNKEAPLTDTYNITMTLVEVNRYEENYNFQQALACVRPVIKNFDQLNSTYKPIIIAEYLFLLLVSSHEEEKEIKDIAENEWFKRQSELEQADVKRILATYALVVEKDTRKCDKLLVEAKLLIKKIPFQTDRNHEIKLINYIEDLMKVKVQ